MSAFLAATGAVAFAEIGDKTQLLSFVLAARYRKPWPIILGILVSTVLNHAMAAAAGAWVMAMVGPHVLRWVLGGPVRAEQRARLGPFVPAASRPVATRELGVEAARTPARV